MLRRLRAGEDPLDLSIEKWKDIIDSLQKIQHAWEFNENLERGAENCALCEEFSEVREVFSDCRRCPVYKETGEHNCLNTPYYEFREALKEGNLSAMLYTAKRMLKLLEKIKTKNMGDIFQSLEDKLKLGKKLSNDDITKLIEIDNFAQEHNLSELHEKVAKIIVSLEKTIPAEEIELKEGETKKFSENVVIRKRKDNMIEIEW